MLQRVFGSPGPSRLDRIGSVSLKTGRCITFDSTHRSALLRVAVLSNTQNEAKLLIWIVFFFFNCLYLDFLSAPFSELLYFLWLHGDVEAAINT